MATNSSNKVPSGSTRPKIKTRKCVRSVDETIKSH